MSMLAPKAPPDAERLSDRLSTLRWLACRFSRFVVMVQTHQTPRRASSRGLEIRVGGWGVLRSFSRRHAVMSTVLPSLSSDEPFMAAVAERRAYKYGR